MVLVVVEAEVEAEVEVERPSILASRDVRNVKCVCGSIQHQPKKNKIQKHKKKKKTQTIDILRDLHRHLHEPQLVDACLEITHEPLEDVYAVRVRLRVVEELDQFRGQLVP